MTLAKQIAQQFREVYLDGKWVVTTNLKAELSTVTWQQATTKVGDLNTIAALTFHLNYYIAGLIPVLKGGSLDIKDKYSFDCPLIESEVDWQQLLEKSWSNAETFADLIAQKSDDEIMAAFVEEKYGNYYKNLQAIIQHSFYHLGQIVLIKKLLRNE